MPFPSAVCEPRTLDTVRPPAGRFVEVIIMNGKALRGILLLCLLVPAVGAIGLAQQASASASASSDGPAKATIGLFPFRQGDRLAVELTREDPCSCLCSDLSVTGLRLVDADGEPVAVSSADSSAFPILAQDWVGRIALVHTDGTALTPGRYTVIVETGLGEFRAEIEVRAASAPRAAGRITSRASVCGIELHVYRLLDEASDGSTVTLSDGDLLMVALPGNPTTGYRWMAEQAPTGLLEELPGPDFQPESSLIGAGGTFYFRYVAHAPGTGTLTFSYLRPWESVPPEKTVTLTIHVE